MRAHDVVAVVDLLAREDIIVWLDGGWGIDALLGRETRDHADLDLVVAQRDLDRAAGALARVGFAHDERAEPGLPARFVLAADDGRRVDLHPVVFDAGGNGWQPLGNGAWGAYPADGLEVSGEVARHAVRCISAELQVRHHLGYPPADHDRHDLRLLSERFGVALPPGFLRGAPAERRT